VWSISVHVTPKFGLSKASLEDGFSVGLLEVIKMSLGTILLIILVLLLVGALPTWPYSGSWGYYPSSGLGLILVVFLVLILTGRL
jgi:hypothetical protein